MILIGLTGGIACGKSTVSTILENEYDIHIIDADKIVRKLQQAGSACTEKIRRRWPSCVNSETGELNRVALGQLVFADPRARRELGRIMNMPICFAILTEIISAWWHTPWTVSDDARIVVLDAPTLFETRWLTYLVSNTLVVASAEETQVRRLLQRNGLCADEAKSRVAAQMPLDKKRRMAGYVIENNEDNLSTLQSQVSDCVLWMRRQSGSKLSAMAALIVLGGTCCIGAVAYNVIMAGFW